MLLLVALLAGLPMTQVHFTAAPLDEALRHATWVVVVERPAKGAQPSDTWPQRWRVVETLFWRDPTPPAPARATELTVHPSDQAFRDAMAAHIAEHGYAGAPSPIFPRYASTLSPERLARERRAILFLRRYKSDWALAIEGGWEALGQRAAITKLLSTSK